MTSIIVHTVCRYCDLDIEGPHRHHAVANPVWLDRGGNHMCHSSEHEGYLHVPAREDEMYGETPESRRQGDEMSKHPRGLCLYPNGCTGCNDYVPPRTCDKGPGPSQDWHTQVPDGEPSRYTIQIRNSNRVEVLDLTTPNHVVAEAVRVDSEWVVSACRDDGSQWTLAVVKPTTTEAQQRAMVLAVLHALY